MFEKWKGELVSKNYENLDNSSVVKIDLSRMKLKDWCDDDYHDKCGNSEKCYFDPEGGEYWIEIERDLDKQIFVYKIGKGIIGVSDLVEYEGRYYSRVPNKEKIKIKSIHELRSDYLILKYVFRDTDHAIIDLELENKANKFLADDSNISIDRLVNGLYKYYFYDFNFACQMDKEEYFKKMLSKTLSFYKESGDFESLKLVLTKIKMIRERINETDIVGSTMDTIKNEALRLQYIDLVKRFIPFLRRNLKIMEEEIKKIIN